MVPMETCGEDGQVEMVATRVVLRVEMLTRVQMPPSLLRSLADVVRELNGWADGPLMDSALMFWACCLLVVSGLRNMLSGLGPFSLIKNYPDRKKKK